MTMTTRTMSPDHNPRTDTDMMSGIASAMRWTAGDEPGTKTDPDDLTHVYSKPRLLYKSITPVYKVLQLSSRTYTADPTM